MKTFVNDYDFSNLVNAQEGIDLNQYTPTRFQGVSIEQPSINPKFLGIVPVKPKPKVLREIDMGTPRPTNPQEYVEIGQVVSSTPNPQMPQIIREVLISDTNTRVGIRNFFKGIKYFKDEKLKLDILRKRLAEARNQQRIQEAKRLEAMLEKMNKQITDLEEALRKSNQSNIINAVEDIKKNPSVPIEQIAEGIPEIPKDVVEEVVAKPSKNSWVVPALVIGVIAYLVFKK
jgi:hypothetical protein